MENNSPTKSIVKRLSSRRLKYGTAGNDSLDHSNRSNTTEQKKRKSKIGKLKKILTRGRLKKHKKKKQKTTNSDASLEDDSEAVSLNSSCSNTNASDGEVVAPTTKGRRRRSQQQQAASAAQIQKSKSAPNFNLTSILTKGSKEDHTNSFEEEELYPGSSSFLSSTTNNLTPSKQHQDLLQGQQQRSYDTNSIEECLFKIVLLLIDPTTRRFELLHLEFETGNVTVYEVLSQVSDSVVDETLRNKPYVGLSNHDSITRSNNETLSSFCTPTSSNNVLVAIPSDTTRTQDIVNLAMPIITDEKITKMFRASGIDASAWKNKKLALTPVKQSNNSTITDNLSPSSPTRHITEKSSTLSELSKMNINLQINVGSLLLFVGVVLFALLCQFIFFSSSSGGRSLFNLIVNKTLNMCSSCPDDEQGWSFATCMGSCIQNMVVPV